MDRGSRIVSFVTVVLLVGACTTTSAGATPSSPAAGGGATQGAGGGGTGTGGLPGSACNLLSMADIQGAVGAPVQAGVEQDTDTQVACNWNETAATNPSVGISVAIYDDSLWQAGSQAGNSTAVSGIGDAAFKGWPTAGTLNIKVKGYMVTVGVVDFSKPTATIDPESLALAKIVVSKL